jgi:hypothetical protein
VVRTPLTDGADVNAEWTDVSSPILAWSDFTSIAGMAGVPPPDPKISEALPSSCDFQAVI